MMGVKERGSGEATDDKHNDLDHPKHNYFKPVRGNHNVVDRSPFRIARIPTFDQGRLDERHLQQ